MTKECCECGKKFEARTTLKLFCHQSCARRWKQRTAARQQARLDPTRRKIRSARKPHADTALWEQGEACVICEWTIKGPRGCGLEVHHIKAVADGGDNEQDNLVILCPNHHEEAGVGLITPETLREFRTIAILKASGSRATYLKEVVGRLRFVSLEPEPVIVAPVLPEEPPVVVEVDDSRYRWWLSDRTAQYEMPVYQG